jgi:hypothetical protein
MARRDGANIAPSRVNLSLRRGADRAGDSKMAARSDTYRRLAIQAKQQSSLASDPEVRQGFADLADHWSGLAEQSDWLDNRLLSSMAQQQRDWPCPATHDGRANLASLFCGAFLS